MGILIFREEGKQSACPSCLDAAKAQRVEIRSERVGVEEHVTVRCKDCGRLLSDSRLAAQPEKKKPSLEGTWTGIYFYGEAPPVVSKEKTPAGIVTTIARLVPGITDPSGRPFVRFQAHLKETAEGFEGLITESGAVRGGMATLSARVKGGIDAQGIVHFVKQYDGSGGVTNTIDYSGQLSPDGAAIEGTWTYGFGRSGGFQMRRDY